MRVKDRGTDLAALGGREEEMDREGDGQGARERKAEKYVVGGERERERGRKKSE